MAKIVKWKQRLALGLVALFLSMARVWLPETRNSVRPGDPIYSRLLTGIGAKTAFGVELMAQRPYLRLVCASLNPISLPLMAGAYLAMAASGGMPAAAAGASCSSCNTFNAPCCSVTDAACCNNHCEGSDCHTIFCTNFVNNATYDCVTCGRGTCHSTNACG